MDLEISSDPDRLDLALIHGWLSEKSYWARGRTMEVVRRAIDNSICFGGYLDGRQVAFARVVTDRATHAWLADVFVLDDYRGRGYGKALIRAVIAHPELQDLRRWLLATKDAHSLYEQFGFTPIPPGRFMERRDPKQ